MAPAVHVNRAESILILVQHDHHLPALVLDEHGRKRRCHVPLKALDIASPKRHIPLIETAMLLGTVGSERNHLSGQHSVRDVGDGALPDTFKILRVPLLAALVLRYGWSNRQQHDRS